MGREQPFPFNEAFFSNSDEYADALLDFVEGNELLRTLCGGVHILDFFTSEPDLYGRIFLPEWRKFFAQYEILDILEFLMRDDLEDLHGSEKLRQAPPSLIEFIRTVRKLLLNRHHDMNQCARNRAMKPTQKLARHVAVGMNVKKVHEVGLFASYIDTLAKDISQSLDEPLTHLVDFGSGQNYLGRALASEPYNRNIVAIESKASNAEKARELDVLARLVDKQRFMRNKKAFRAGLEGPGITVPQPLATPPPEPEVPTTQIDENGTVVELPPQGTGKIQYVDHVIQDGQLDDVLERLPADPNPNLMVMSLHSCGNLVHHGLRSLILNPAVKAVAMVGCCYNLTTERLGPATYKLPELRPTTHSHPRLHKTGEAHDPHGFPMSTKLCEYRYPKASPDSPSGVRLNITARMMAVQAPQNWGEADSASFFTRHFYRALLQRVFLDRGVVGRPSSEFVGGRSAAGHSSGGTPIIIGSLRKTCYESFVNYVRGALAKLMNDPKLGEVMRKKMGDISDEEIAGYEERYAERKKDLSITWSLMAFSAGVIESAFVLDRWLWLKEQEDVKEAWVEPVFDYRMSPRNLVVVGIKK